jgi:hypothetical protein
MSMLRKSATKYYGCCDRCARKVAKEHKPGPRERHQARALEKRRWKREERV